MRRGTFEIEAVAGFKKVVLSVVQPDFEFSAHDVKKLFTLMSVRFTAAAAGFDAKEMRLHGGIAPSEKFHAHVGAGLENFALSGTDEALRAAIGFEKGHDVGLVETRDAPQSAN